MSHSLRTPQSEEQENLVAFLKLLLEVDQRVNPERYERPAVEASDTNKDG